MRGSRALVTLPKLPLLMSPLGFDELRVVENVEEFTANFERLGFPDGNYLRYPEIGVVETRAVKEAAVRGTESFRNQDRSRLPTLERIELR